jgi:MFS family permease
MDTNVKSLQRKALQYWWIDGLAELAFALEMIVISLYFVLVQQIHSEPWTVIAASVGMPAIFLTTFFLAGKLVLYVKEKITFPRTGYVRYPKRKAISRKRRLVVGAVIGFVTAVAVNLSREFLGSNAQWIVVTLIMMMGMIYIGYLVEVYRYYAIGVLIFLWGIAMIWMTIPSGYEYAWLFGGIGLINLIFGLAVFLRYLKHYPKVEGEAYDG